MTMKLASRRTTRRSGFTLIEIMIVVAIIGLLVAALLPSISQARKKSAEGACKTILTRIQAVKQTWALDNHKGDEATPAEGDLFGDGKYMDKPNCPSGGTFTLNPVGQKPLCSSPGHKLE